MVDFSQVKEIAIPEGNVKRINVGSTTVWKKEAPQPLPENILKFTSEGNGTIYLENYGGNNPDCKCSFNGVSWFSMPLTSPGLTLTNGQTLFVKGNNPNGFSTSSRDNSAFVMSGEISASGSIMSLIDGTGENLIIPNPSCFYGLFYDCASLASAPALPATTLADYCYESMFSYCESLISAPELPATTLAEGCYQNMFEYCESLTLTPELPATELADSCYNYMFQGCHSLTSAPELPAITLAYFCYSNMFNDCYSLTSAPALPATTLVEGCYYEMFKDCTELKVDTSGYQFNKIFTTPSSIPDYAVDDMFDGTGGLFTGTPTENNTYYWY